MVLPITGPTNVESHEWRGMTEYYKWRRVMKQAKPVDRPLPYLLNSATCHWLADTGPTGNPGYNAETSSSYGLPLNFGTATTAAWNRCYDKLKDSLGSRASVGNSLAEADQSLTMIRNRALQLFKFGRQIRRGDFSGAAKTLKIPQPKAVSSRKAAASNYLEYYFGWSPLVGDIYDAIDVLQSEMPPFKIKESATTAKNVPVSYGNTSSGSLPIETVAPGSYHIWEEFYTRAVTERVSMGCEVAVVNYNLWLANQLGLVNPVSVAWELVPFSFVVDWFVNVGQFLEQGTDFYGLSISKQWNTRTQKGGVYMKNVHWSHWREYFYSPFRQVFHPYVVNHHEFHGTYTWMQRELGLVTPELIVRPWKAWKWKRTAAAVSLLVQQVRGLG